MPGRLLPLLPLGISPLAKAPLWEFPSLVAVFTNVTLASFPGLTHEHRLPTPPSQHHLLTWIMAMASWPLPAQSPFVSTQLRVSDHVTPLAPWLLKCQAEERLKSFWDFIKNSSPTATPVVSSHPSFIQLHPAPCHDCVCTCSMLHLGLQRLP